MATRSYVTALFLAGSVITLTLIGCASVLFINPYTLVADSPSSATPTLRATAPATPTPFSSTTPSHTATTTPTQSPTSISTSTPSPTATATVTPSPTPNPETFAPLSPAAVPNCGVTMIKGQLRSSDTLINDIPVHVWWEGAEGVFSVPSGRDPTKPDGYWDVVLDSRAKAGRWFVAVADPVSKGHISPVVTVETDETPCEPDSAGRQIITVDFVLQGQPIGSAGPTLTPSPTPTPTFTPTPYPTPDGQSRTVQVPILMYHYISSPPQYANRYRRDLSVSPDAFRSHMTYLRDQGYQVISLHDLVYAVQRGTPLPPKPIIITFDDGYRDNYTNAFPMLKEFGYTATFFVLTDFIDQGLPEYMTWEQLREMHNAGMEIGSHSRDHPDLRGKSDEYLIWQILGSSQTIEAELGFRPEVFSYPSGRYDQRTVDIVRSAHYWAAVTTSGGMVHDREDLLKLERIRVRGGWTPADLQRTLDYWAQQGE